MGTDFDRAWLAENGVTWRALPTGTGGLAVATILPGIHVAGNFARNNRLEAVPERFRVDRPSGRIHDDFSDEICLALERPEGIAVVVGCAHPGLMNMLEAIREHFHKPLRAVVGGSHLVEADQARIDATVAYLESSGCPLVALGHCTGEAGAAALATKLAAYVPLHTGQEIIIE